MLRFGLVLKKAVQVIITLFAVITFNFLLFRVLPGDPIRLIARAGNLSPEAISRLRDLFGLDKPLVTQYFYYLRNLFTGEFGMSYTYRRPVIDILQERIANTVILLAAATVIVVLIGVAAGVIAAARRGSKTDQSLVVTSLVFWSLPTFWTGLILVILLGVYVKAFPVSGITTPGASFDSSFARLLDLGKHLVLPTITLAIVDMGQFMLITRSTLVDVLTEDYILTGKAKGLPFRRVLWGHAVPNALLPIITTTALYVSLVIGGAIQVETVFSWPGMGRLMYDAVLRRDYPILEASFLFLAATVILANFLSDIMYMVIDPRVKEA
ncbi:MAG: ABC transporter permease [Chloroflexi bacterium]|nr:ABC transporter permease [Chloroflexota bacterium]